MLYKKYKKVEDKAIIKKIKKSGDRDEFLFTSSDYAYNRYYLYVDGKIYLTEADFYSSQFFPIVSHYEISFGYFLEDYNKFKKENSKYEESKVAIQNTDKFISDNSEQLLENDRVEYSKEIDSAISNLQEMIETAKELGIKDEWSILKNGKPIKYKKNDKILSLKPETPSKEQN